MKTQRKLDKMQSFHEIGENNVKAVDSGINIPMKDDKLGEGRNRLMMIPLSFIGLLLLLVILFILWPKKLINRRMVIETPPSDTQTKEDIIPTPYTQSRLSPSQPIVTSNPNRVSYLKGQFDTEIDQSILVTGLLVQLCLMIKRKLSMWKSLTALKSHF